MKKEDLFDSLIVVKRSGQRCDFQGEKIAIAIKKAFDSVENKYETGDVNHIYSSVLKKISNQYMERKTIKIEDIQDIIEETLKEKKYESVYLSFKTYREQRSISRESFTIKEQHKFLKAMERLGLNGSEDPCLLGETLPPSEMFYNFGSVIAQEFAESYLLDSKTVRSIDSGLVFLHHLEYYPMGSTSSVQLLFSKLIAKDDSEHIFNALMSLSKIIRNVFAEQHGNLIIPCFPKEFEPILLKHFITIWKQILTLKLSSFGLQAILPMEDIYRKIEQLNSLEIKLADFSLFYQSSKPMENLFLDSYRESLEDLQNTLKKAIEWFFDELEFSYETNFKHQVVTISFGTETSLAGMMIQKVLIDCFQKKEYQSVRGIYKVKKGFNLEKKDLMYEVFLASLDAYQKNSIDFEFLDVSFNNKKEEVGYGFLGERVYEDITTIEPVLIGEKGTISSISINLPRIALRHFNSLDETLFFDELKETMDLAKNYLLERFEYQCNKHNYNFPFLIGKGVWCFGESVKENDRLRKVLKHGVLQVHFVGLYETIKMLTGSFMEEAEEAYQLSIKIVTFMKTCLENYSNENHLNFALCDTNMEHVSKLFLELDRAIYGKVKGVTDGLCYTNAFHLPCKIDVMKRLTLEAPFHRLCLGGHVFYLNKIKNGEKMENIINQMITHQIGFTSYKEMET